METEHQNWNCRIYLQYCTAQWSPYIFITIKSRMAGLDYRNSWGDWGDVVWRNYNFDACCHIFSTKRILKKRVVCSCKTPIGFRNISPVFWSLDTLPHSVAALPAIRGFLPESAKHLQWSDISLRLWHDGFQHAFPPPGCQCPSHFVLPRGTTTISGWDMVNLSQSWPIEKWWNLEWNHEIGCLKIRILYHWYKE